MKKIKAILSDFDGTLVDKNEQYQPGVKTLIKKIQSKNVKFSLATGRAYYSSSLKRIEEELKIKGVHIFHGGGMILNSQTNKILWEQTISNKSAKLIIKYFLDKKLMFSLEAKKYVYLSHYQRKFIFYQNIPIKTIGELKETDEIYKIVLFARDNKLNESELNLHLDNLKKNCSDISAIEFEFSNLFGADITSEKATKHTAVLEYLKILNLSPDEVVAIGDGPNDYPLFTASGFGIAMANAPKELKEIADLIVSKVTEGGMIEALKYIDENLT